MIFIFMFLKFKTFLVVEKQFMDYLCKTALDLSYKYVLT